jgi:AP-1 complex subunit sigma 1/2
MRCAQAYYILDELIIAGELQESSKKAVLRVCAAQDALMEENKDGAKEDDGMFN